MAESWFPGGRFNPVGWRLDIISLLAVIGDSSVSIHAQEITASWLCLLPRLIPAPQALLRSSRPRRLHAPSATITGVYSGININEINFFANIIHDIDRVHPFEFRHYEISLNRGDESTLQENEKKTLPYRATESDIEASPTLTRDKASATSFGSSKSEKEYIGPPLVPPKKTSPMNMLTIFSSVISIGAFIWAACIKDGIALVAIASISIASSAIGLGLWWQPQLAQRPISSPAPGGDVVIRTRSGAFIFVRCEESVARELYVGSERCEYLVEKTTIFRILSGSGTLLLMVSVVLLGNCTWTMQAVVGGIYVLLNGLYWMVSILPKKHFWDMSRYVWKDVTQVTLKNAHLLEEESGRPPSWTRTLWYAIYATKSVDWVKNSGATPNTEAWDKWVDEAYQNRENRLWEAEKARDRLMKEAAQGRRNSIVETLGTGPQADVGSTVDQ